MAFELEKLSEYLSDENQWMVGYINDDNNIIEMCERFLCEAEYDGDPMGDSASALFEAFISYKQNGIINREDAKYLRKRGGVIGKYFKELDTCFSVKDLIKLIDGDGFEKWLNSPECYKIQNINHHNIRPNWNFLYNN